MVVETWLIILRQRIGLVAILGKDMQRTRILMGAMALVVAAAAAAGDGQPAMPAEGDPAPKIGLLDSAARKIQKLLEGGDAAGAETLFLEKEDKLKDKPYYLYLQTKTADAVRQSLAPQMTDAQSTLTAINGRGKFTDNAVTDVAAALGKASGVLRAYQAHALLQRPQYAMPEAEQINAQLVAVGAGLKKNVAGFFAAHPHAESNFFESYPLQLSDDERRALVAGSDRWIDAAMASEQPGRVLGQYLPWASEQRAAQARSALAALLIKHNRWKAPPTLPQEFHLAMQLAQEMGTSAAAVAMITIGGADAGLPGVEQRQLQSASELGAALDSLRAGGVRYVLVRDLGRVLTYEQVKGPGKPETGQRVVGTRKATNPAYAQAQAALQQAQQNLAAAQQRAASTAATNNLANSLLNAYVGGDNQWGAIAGKMAGNLAAGSANASVAGAQAQFNQAQLTLTNTPTMIDEPVEQPYQVPTRLVERTKIQELALYYLDLETNRLAVATQRETRRKTMSALVQFDPNDARQQELKSRNEAQLADLRLELPELLPLTEMLNRLDDPLSLMTRAETVAGMTAAKAAARVVADADAWETWAQQQLAGNSTQVFLEPLYMLPVAAPREEQRPALAMMPAGLTDPDSILWYETKATGTVEAYEWYIERFPNGLRVGPARSEIRRLQGSEREQRQRAEEDAIARREEQQRAVEAAAARREEDARQAALRRQEEEVAAQARAEQQQRQAAADAERRKREARELREDAATIPSF